MSEIVYGYIRVSTKEQNEDRQRIAMEEFGIPEEYIFLDKQSGKDFERPAYQELMKRLKPDDTLVVKRRRLGLIQRHRAVEGLKPLDIWD